MQDARFWARNGTTDAALTREDFTYLRSARGQENLEEHNSRRLLLQRVLRRIVEDLCRDGAGPDFARGRAGGDARAQVPSLGVLLQRRVADELAALSLPPTHATGANVLLSLVAADLSHLRQKVAAVRAADEAARDGGDSTAGDAQGVRDAESLGDNLLDVDFSAGSDKEELYDEDAASTKKAKRDRSTERRVQLSAAATEKRAERHDDRRRRGRSEVVASTTTSRAAATSSAAVASAAPGPAAPKNSAKTPNDEDIVTMKIPATNKAATKAKKATRD
jgi:hypothetical protein